MYKITHTELEKITKFLDQISNIDIINMLDHNEMPLKYNDLNLMLDKAKLLSQEIKDNYTKIK
jgi:hypothetical protein